MSNSRRNFCKNSVYIGLGLSFSPLINHAKADKSINKKVLNLTKKVGRVVSIEGKICYEDLSPVINTEIKICHNNSANNPSNFEYEGKLRTDSGGNYHFETDFPEKHFEDGYYKMSRIFFKIKQKNGEEILTKLYFGANGNASIDSHHWDNTPEKHRAELPKTKHENNDLISIHFNIYLIL